METPDKEHLNEATTIKGGIGSGIKNELKSKMRNDVDAVTPKKIGVEGYLDMDDYLANVNVRHQDNMLTITMPTANKTVGTLSTPTSKGIENLFDNLSQKAFKVIKDYLKSLGVSRFEDEDISGNVIFLISDEIQRIGESKKEFNKEKFIEMNGGKKTDEPKKEFDKEKFVEANKRIKETTETYTIRIFDNKNRIIDAVTVEKELAMKVQDFMTKLLKNR